MMRKGWALASLLCLTALGLGTPVDAQQAVGLSRKIELLADKLAFASEGKVLAVKGETVYISLGLRDGVAPGNVFEVVRLGAPLMVDKEILGYEETVVGEIEVQKARKKLSIGRVMKKTGEIKKRDRVYQKRKKVKRVAVGEFLFRNATNALTRNIQNVLYTSLVQKGLKVAERRELEKVLGELKISMTDLVNPKYAKKAGNLLGVDAIVLGSVSDLGDNISILARLVDVEQGAALTAAGVDLPKTPMIAKLLREAVSEEGVPSPRPGKIIKASPSQKGIISFKDKSFDNRWFRLDLLQVRSVGRKELAFVFTILNKSKEEGYYWVYDAGRSDQGEFTYLVDANGIRHGLKSGTQIGKRQMRLAPGIKYRFQLTFPRPSAATSPVQFVTKMETDRRYSVIIRDVPLPQ